MEEITGNKKISLEGGVFRYTCTPEENVYTDQDWIKFSYSASSNILTVRVLPNCEFMRTDTDEVNHRNLSGLAYDSQRRTYLNFSQYGLYDGAFQNFIFYINCNIDSDYKDSYEYTVDGRKEYSVEIKKVVSLSSWLNAEYLGNNKYKVRFNKVERGLIHYGVVLMLGEDGVYYNGIVRIRPRYLTYINFFSRQPKVLYKGHYTGEVQFGWRSSNKYILNAEATGAEVRFGIDWINIVSEITSDVLTLRINNAYEISYKVYDNPTLKITIPHTQYTLMGNDWRIPENPYKYARKIEKSGWNEQLVEFSQLSVDDLYNWENFSRTPITSMNDLHVGDLFILSLSGVFGDTESVYSNTFVSRNCDRHPNVPVMINGKPSLFSGSIWYVGENLAGKFIAPVSSILVESNSREYVLYSYSLKDNASEDGYYLGKSNFGNYTINNMVYNPYYNPYTVTAFKYNPFSTIDKKQIDFSEMRINEGWGVLKEHFILDNISKSEMDWMMVKVIFHDNDAPYTVLWSLPTNESYFSSAASDDISLSHGSAILYADNDNIRYNDYSIQAEYYKCLNYFYDGSEFIDEATFIVKKNEQHRYVKTVDNIYRLCNSGLNYNDADRIVLGQYSNADVETAPIKEVIIYSYEKGPIIHDYVFRTVNGVFAVYDKITDEYITTYNDKSDSYLVNEHEIDYEIHNEGYEFNYSPKTINADYDGGVFNVGITIPENAKEVTTKSFIDWATASDVDDDGNFTINVSPYHGKSIRRCKVYITVNYNNGAIYRSSVDVIQKPDYKFEYTPDEIISSSSGGTYTIDFSISDNVVSSDVVSDNDWISLSRVDADTYRATVSENYSVLVRNGNVTITLSYDTGDTYDAVIPVTQYGKKDFEYSPSVIYAEYTEGEYEFAIIQNDDIVSVTTTSDKSWMSTSRTDGRYYVSVLKNNTEYERGGNITITALFNDGSTVTHKISLYQQKDPTIIIDGTGETIKDPDGAVKEGWGCLDNVEMRKEFNTLGGNCGLEVHFVADAVDTEYMSTDNFSIKCINGKYILKSGSLEIETDFETDTSHTVWLLSDAANNVVSIKTDTGVYAEKTGIPLFNENDTLRIRGNYFNYSVVEYVKILNTQVMDRSGKYLVMHDMRFRTVDDDFSLYDASYDTYTMINNTKSYLVNWADVTMSRPQHAPSRKPPVYQGNLRQEEHYIYRLVKQYSEPAIILEVDMLDNGISNIAPYTIISEKYTPDKLYIIDEFGYNYAENSVQLKLVEKK